MVPINKVIHNKYRFKKNLNKLKKAIKLFS